VKLSKFFALFLLLGLAPAGAAPHKTQMHSVSVGGVVRTDATTEPSNDRLPYVPVVGVHVEMQGKECLSDEHGFFHFDDLPKGVYTLTFSLAGYTSVEKSAKVSNDGFPPNLSVVMNPIGTSGSAERPSGSGTIYVAFGERQNSIVANARDGPGLSLENGNMQAAIINGADPLSLGGNSMPETNSKDLDQNTVSTDPNTLMVYPPGQPSRTWFDKLQMRPFWVCFNRTGSTLFVSTASQMVQVIDIARNHRVVANVATRGPITDLSLSLDGRYVLAAVMGHNGITLIDATSGLPAGFISCASAPRAVAMAGSRLFVVEGDSRSGRVEVLDLVKGSVSCVVVGANPTGLAVTPDGTRLLVVNSGAASVSVVDTRTLVETARVAVGVNPAKVAISADGNRAAVTNKGGDSVSILDPHTLTVLATVGVNAGPIGVVTSPDSRKAYVGCKDAGTVVTLDLLSGQILHTTLPMPHSSPFGLAIRP
jgi:YVTN family beta-propeller protein